MTDTAIVIRKATDEELVRIGGWFAWGYERGQKLALWPDGEATIYNEGVTHPGYVAILWKDV